MDKRFDKKQIVQIIEVGILLCVIFVGICIGLPYYMHKYKQQHIEMNYYSDYQINDFYYSKTYKDFWDNYNRTMLNYYKVQSLNKLSLQQQKDFHDSFFNTYDLTVDDVTKIVYKNNEHADPKSLSCLILNFHKDRTWIRPVCPSL